MALARRIARIALVIVAAASLGGCGNGMSLPSLPTLNMPALSLPTIPPLATQPPDEPAPEKLPASQTLAASPTLEMSPAEAYTLIARGILTCWFGATGPLKATHIFSADAPSPAVGGDVDIAIHVRDPSQPSPRGARAFRIHLVKEGEARTRLSMQNHKIAADLAAAMERDVLSWAASTANCEAQVVRPPQPAPLAVKPAPKKKPKKA